MPKHDTYQQPIVVLATTHEATVTAAALASVAALNTVISENWAPWLEGAFTKTVRRAKNPTQFSRISGLPGAGPIQQVGDALAVGFAPTTVEEMDPALRKLQVAGTDCGHTGQWPRAGQNPLRVVVNSGLGMTTGKTAAQVAHALMAHVLQQESGYDVALENLLVEEEDGEAFISLADRASVVIEDAGRTEIEPGSMTVLVL